jgi:lysophospholipase L1-like esterase
MPRPLSRRRKAAFSAAILLAAIALPIATLEAGGRVVMWRRHGVAGKSYGIWRADPELGAVHVPSSYNAIGEMNAQGLRGREDALEPKPIGSSRVLCYGGSSTYCYNLRDGDTWPERLQERLRAVPSGASDQVLNGGHVAWSLAHLVVMAGRQVPVLRPDVVILYSGVNEELNARYLREAGLDPAVLLAEGRFVVPARNLPQARWLERKSLTVKLWRRGVDRLVQRREGQERRDRIERHEPVAPDRVVFAESDAAFLSSWEWQSYERALRQMIELVRANGATPLFVVEVGVGARNASKLRFSAEGARIAGELGVATCDPRHAFAAREDAASLFSDTGIHVTAEGARLLADEVARCLRQLEDARPGPTAFAPPARTAP